MKEEPPKKRREEEETWAVDERGEGGIPYWRMKASSHAIRASDESPNPLKHQGSRAHHIRADALASGTRSRTQGGPESFR